MIQIDTAELITLMKQLDAEEPIDFSNVPSSSEELYELVAKNIGLQVQGLQDAEFSEEHQMILMQVIVARLLLENLVLKLDKEIQLGKNPREALRALQSKLRATIAEKEPSKIILP